MSTRNQEIDKAIKDHDKAISDIQVALNALMKQQEQSIKQQEQLLKHATGGSFLGGSSTNDIMDPKTNRPMHETPKMMKQRYAVILLERDAIQWHQAFMKTSRATVAELSRTDYARAISTRFSNAMFEYPMEDIASLQKGDELHEYNNAFDALLNKDEEEMSGEVSNKKEDNSLQILIHALTGLPSYSTMRIQGTMGNRQLHILVDSGSTHNFIDVKLAKKLQCVIKDIPPLSVGVAEGRQLKCNQMCSGFQWAMQDGKLCELKEIQTNKVSTCSMEKVDSLWQKHRKEGSLQLFNLQLTNNSPKLHQNPDVETGHLISGDDVRTDPSKVEAIQEWLIPKTLKQLRGFLGLAEYYGRFIRSFRIIARPLTNLLKKDAFKWSDETQRAFLEIKTALSTAPHGLKHLLMHKVTTQLQHKWLARLLGYDYTIEYKAGQENVAADSLSRVQGLTLFTMTMSQIEPLLLDEIVASQGNDIQLKYGRTSSRRRTEMSMDFIGVLPKVQGKDIIFMVVDRLTKYSHFMVLGHPYSAKECVLEEILSTTRHRVETVHSLPPSNGRSNRALYGLPPPLHIPYIPKDSGDKEVDELMRDREATMNVLKQSLHKAHNRMKQQADKHQTEREFSMGSWVYLKLQSAAMKILVQWKDQSATWEYLDELQLRLPDLSDVIAFPF
nr:hypothetical protein [Tanacetum cinerariifolium]